MTKDRTIKTETLNKFNDFIEWLYIEGVTEKYPMILAECTDEFGCPVSRRTAQYFLAEESFRNLREQAGLLQRKNKHSGAKTKYKEFWIKDSNYRGGAS